MMKLSTILKVDSTIDPQGQSHIAEHILDQWEHDPVPAHFFRSSANFVYMLQKDGERHFLRFAESSERSEAEISAEMALLSWLATQGIPVTTPVPSKTGRYMETVETDIGTFYAVVFAALQGSELEIEELSEDQFEQWGATLGQLHTTMHQYQAPELSSRRTWKDHLNTARLFLPEDEPRVQAGWDYLNTWLSSLPVTDTNYGLIHGDFELDNLFWQNKSIAILDFDDCSYYWYVADIAFALRDLFENGVDLSNPSLHAFIRGYRQHTSLDEEAISQLPTWMRLSNLLTYAKLMRTMDLATDQDCPEWCTSLLSKLENWIHNFKASLLSFPV